MPRGPYRFRSSRRAPRHLRQIHRRRQGRGRNRKRIAFQTYRMHRVTYKLWDETNAAWTDKLQATAASSVYKGFTFHLSDLPDYTDFTNLFDQYQITGIRLTFHRFQNVSLTGTANADSILPLTYVTTDFDDVAVITEDQLCQYDKVKVYTSGRTFKIFFRPKVLSPVYESAVTSAYANPIAQPWISTADPDVDFFGLRTLMTQTGAQGLSGWMIRAKYYLRFRNVK